MNDCQCTLEGPGWCERHKCHKSAVLVQLCRTNPRYWNAWEAGRGPNQAVPKPRPGLGDTLAAGLAAVGVTKERYVAAKAAVGLKRRCDCPKRQEALNALGRKLGIG